MCRRSRAILPMCLLLHQHPYSHSPSLCCSCLLASPPVRNILTRLPLPVLLLLHLSHYSVWHTRLCCSHGLNQDCSTNAKRLVGLMSRPCGIHVLQTPTFPSLLLELTWHNIGSRTTAATTTSILQQPPALPGCVAVADDQYSSAWARTRHPPSDTPTGSKAVKQC